MIRKLDVWFIVLLLISSATGISFNQPKFCANATWDPNGITFVNYTAGPFGLFVDRSDIVYSTEQNSNDAIVWSQNGTNSARILSGNLNSPGAIFVSEIGDIYVDNGQSGQVVKWTSNGTNSIPVMNVPAQCLGLFMDKNNSLYCSLNYKHSVVKMDLDGITNISTTIAGNGIAGSDASSLQNPNGIFVDENFTLYVADFFNSRIQRFYFGEINATTVAGNGASNSISLNGPTGVVLDADGYLFIVDMGNARIVGSGLYGFRCIVGCTGSSGSTSTTLSEPRTMSFDSAGNIYVTDRDNNRIQKFLLMTHSCDTTTSTSTTTKTTTTTTTTTTTMTMTSGTTTQKSIIQNCSSPIIMLTPGSSTLASPVAFRRNQEIYIASNIQLNCNQSSLTNIQWAIRMCTSNCSTSIQLDQTILTTSSDLYIPAQTLSYGIYQLTLTVTMVLFSNLSTSSSVYVKISSSNITVNLMLYGTSMITRGYKQDLTLNPGEYTVDTANAMFNAADWEYKYYCRIYDLYQFPTLNGQLLTIDDPRNDTSNPSCLAKRPSNMIAINQSFLTIPALSLASNQTYQFMVQMKNYQTPSLQASGFLLVQVVDSQPQLIALACVISTMCEPNLQYQRVNPTTQIALFSICVDNCTSILNITWNVYYQMANVSNTSSWTPFTPMNFYKNIWFFGSNTTNFTATIQLFLAYPQYSYWRFEVVYTFSSKTSTSAMNFVLNQPPRNGSCSIDPLNGTTATSFTISCKNWFDEDGIDDYLVYFTKDSIGQSLIAFSYVSKFTLLLPAGRINLSVSIQDTLNAITQFNLTSVLVLQDTTTISGLLNNSQDTTNNFLIQSLSNANQNTVNQVLSSVSQQLNTLNTENIQNAVDNNIPLASVSISSLGSSTVFTQTSTSLNTSALTKYNQQLNQYATVRESLLTFASNLPLTNLNSVKLQAATISQLTDATNQLTRTSATVASEKCSQLAQTLDSTATKISYEDVENIGIHVSQCASNVLNAVNGPLQQRTSTLDADYNRANAFPVDYDTDLENSWSNLDLFADGDDFSSATIEKNRNFYYQKQTANQIMTQSIETISYLTSALNVHLNIDQNFTMNTSSMFMLLKKPSADSLSDTSFEPFENTKIHLPQTINHNSTRSIQLLIQPLAIADQARSSSSINTNLSRSISFSMFDSNENELSVQTNSNQSIEIIIPRDPNLVLPSMSFQNVTSFIDHRLFNLHYVNLTNTQSSSVHFEMQPLNLTLGYLLIYKFDSTPQLTSSVDNIDGWTILCPDNFTNESIYTYFLDNQQTANHQSIIFGLRELTSTELTNICMNTSTIDLPITDQSNNFTANYQLRTYVSGCYYLDSNQQWQSNGLIVGPLTNHYQTQCFSTHLTTFAGGFLVLPDPINWNYVFSNASFMKNKTIYLTVICICVIYILLLIYARYKDKKDMEKLGITILSDNNSYDNYFYQILVFTGNRKDAGTNSKVQFVLSGESDETRVRTLINRNRKVLQRGGIDTFIMSVPKSLGLLNYIHIWHDNSGQGGSASWFLKYIIVQDLQTMEKSYFICQNWFAVEKADGRIERVLPIAGDYQKQEFSYLLSKQAYHSIAEGHLWFSIFARPPSNKFTRVQRCTCCFVLLFVSMLLNILYYNQTEEAKTSTERSSFTFGPFYITSQQIGIGVIVELISFIPSLLLIQLFRRIKSRQTSPYHSTVYQPNETSQKKQSSLTFPWWCIFLAYGFSLILVLLSIFFIIARGIEFGDLKIQKWLTSLVSGLFSSIILIQPLKILSLTLFFAFFIRKSDDDKHISEYLENIDYLLPEEISISATQSSRTRIDRLDNYELDYARSYRLKEILMLKLIKELILYLSFLSMLAVISYRNSQTNAFFQVQHLRNFFLNSREQNLDYNRISTVNDYWSWLEKRFVVNLRAQQWYNNDQPINLRGFLNDKSNRLIGWAIIQQLRVKSRSCQVKYFNETCTDDYSSSDEEKRSFEPGWINETSQVLNSSIAQAFQYQTGDESGGYIYEFRGSLTDLQSNLSKLQELHWIDRRTRAIIIQLSLYNPNVNLFISVTLLTEFLSSDTVIPQSQFQPISFQLFDSLSQIICIIFYLIIVVYLFMEQIRLIIKLKFDYFRQFWTWIDLGIVACSFTNVGIYVWKHQQYSYIGELFQETNGNSFINLQFVAYVDNLFTYFLGFCSFFGTLKFLRLCRYDSRLLLFTKTLRQLRRDLLSFSCMFAIFFIAFVCLFYLLFTSKLSSCANLFQTIRMLFEMTLMQFDAHQLQEAGHFLGPFTLSLFIFIIVFVCLSMFLAIVYKHCQNVRKETKKNQDQIWSFIWRRFLQWTGLEKRDEIVDQRNHPRYQDSIEQFPDKIGQLLDVLYRLYQTESSRR